ncbi:hypothetical protein GJ496_005893 [Pomphorhynchus laevis]|nr:hypothetical protein GJ496_005893 [Pomphorhynchus laevis]
MRNRKKDNNIAVVNDSSQSIPHSSTIHHSNTDSPPYNNKLPSSTTDSDFVLCLSSSPKEIEKALSDIRHHKSILSEDIIRLQQEICLCNEEIELLDASDDEYNNNTTTVENGNHHDSLVVSTVANRSSQLRSKILSTGIRMFNSNPNDGIQFMINNQLITNDCKDVAALLFNDSRFSKVSIGKYLSEKEDFNVEVLNAFTSLHDFHGIHLVEALRTFLGSFKLPGESQKIDRMLQAFADHYQISNPNVLPDSDSVHLLSYAIVILNTSLHNKNVSKSGKISLDDFIKMVENGIDSVANNNSGKATDAFYSDSLLSKQAITSHTMLQAIYDNVKKQPFKLPDDDTAIPFNRHVDDIFFNPLKEGWMFKLGGNFRNWKRRWFILTGCCLYYFELSSDRTPKGIIPLAVGLCVRDSTDVTKEHCFEIVPLTPGSRIRSRKRNEFGKSTEGSHSFYRFSASSSQEKFEWMYKLRNAMENVSISAESL